MEDKGRRHTRMWKAKFVIPRSRKDGETWGTRHHHVSSHVKPVPLPGLIERLFEDVAGSRSTETSLTLIAAKSQKMQAAGFLKSSEAPRHVGNVMLQAIAEIS